MTTAVTVDQLRNLTDRAARGPLTADEQQRLREGIAQLEALQQIARGYCPDCGRGDAAPTVTDWEQQKQRADHAEAALARQAQETATWRATANTLDAGGPGTPRHRAEQAEQRLARVQRLLDSGPIGTCCDRLVRAALDAPPAATQAPEAAASPLRDLIAAAIYERNNPAHQWADAHPDDLLAYGFDADAVLAVILPATPQLAAHNDGPSVEECREADRRWPLQKTGE